MKHVILVIVFLLSLASCRSAQTNVSSNTTENTETMTEPNQTQEQPGNNESEPENEASDASAELPTINAIIHHPQGDSTTATGERFTNVSVERSEGRWAFMGCSASVAGACAASARIVLNDEQLADYRRLITALFALPTDPPGDGCWRAPDSGLELARGEYLLNSTDRAFQGSLSHSAQCPPKELAQWLFDQFRF